MVKTTPSNAGDAGSIPSRGTEIPHATGQLSLPLQTTSREKPTHGTKTQSSQKQINKSYKKTKNPNCQFWEAGSKNRLSGSKAEYCTCPLHSISPKGWANHLSHPASPTPGCTPTLTLCKEQARPSLGNKEGKLLLVFAIPVLQQGPHCSLPYISCPASSQSVLIGEGQEPWLVT